MKKFSTLYWFLPYNKCNSAIIIHTSPSSIASLPSLHPIPPGHHRAPDWASQHNMLHINFSLPIDLTPIVYIS